MTVYPFAGRRLQMTVPHSADRRDPAWLPMMLGMPSNTQCHTPATLKRPLSAAEVEMRARLRRHVEMLSEVIGIRNTDRPGGLEATPRSIEDHRRAHGYVPQEQCSRAGGVDVRNIEVEIPGTHRTKSH